MNSNNKNEERGREPPPPPPFIPAPPPLPPLSPPHVEDEEEIPPLPSSLLPPPPFSGFLVHQKQQQRGKIINAQKIEWNNVQAVRSSDAGSVFFVDILMSPSPPIEYNNDKNDNKNDKYIDKNIDNNDIKNENKDKEDIETIVKEEEVKEEVVEDIETIVVKGSSTVVQEMFGNMLYKELRIPSPTIKLIQFSDGAPYHTMIRKIKEVSDPENGSLIKVERELNRPFILAMEYFPLLKDFYHLHPSLIGPSNCKKLFQSEKILRQLGKIIAADVIINNWDRLPIIWDNDGNATNLLYQFAYLPLDLNLLNDNNQLEFREIDVNNVKIISIDQAISPIINPNQYLLYQKRIERMIDHLVKEGYEEESPSGRFRKFILDIHSFDIGEEGMEGFRIAMIEGVLEIASMLEVEPARGMGDGEVKVIRRLKGVFDRLSGMCKEDKEKVFENGMRMVSLSFIMDNLSIYHDNRERLQSALDKWKDRKLMKKHSLSLCKPPQFSPSSPSSPFLKVTLFQCSSFDISSLSSFLHSFFATQRKEMYNDNNDNKEYDGDGYEQMANILVFPELFLSHTYKSERADEFNYEQEIVKQMQSISDQYDCLIIWGSAIEQVKKPTMRTYNTTLITGPNGWKEVYRQRKLVMQYLTPGDRIGVWDTPFGRIGVMICFDIENDLLLHDLLSLKPDMIFNPTYISSPQSSDVYLNHTSRTNAMDEIAHKFEYLMREKNVTLFRCDLAIGLASSQIITPSSTLSCPLSSSPLSFSYLLPKLRPPPPPSPSPDNNNNNNDNNNDDNNDIIKDDNNVDKMKEDKEIKEDKGEEEEEKEREQVREWEKLWKAPTYTRSEKRDNTGSRLLVRSLKVELPFTGDVLADVSGAGAGGVGGALDSKLISSCISFPSPSSSSSISSPGISSEVFFTASERGEQLWNGSNLYCKQSRPSSYTPSSSLLMCNPSPQSFVSNTNGKWSLFDWEKEEEVTSGSWLSSLPSFHLLSPPHHPMLVYSSQLSGSVEAVDLRDRSSSSSIMKFDISNNAIREVHSMKEENEYMGITSEGKMIIFDVRKEGERAVMRKIKPFQSIPYSSLSFRPNLPTQPMLIAYPNGALLHLSFSHLLSECDNDNNEDDYAKIVKRYSFTDSMQRRESKLKPFAMNSVIPLPTPTSDYDCKYDNANLHYLCAVNNRIHLLQFPSISSDQNEGVKEITSKHCFHGIHGGNIDQLYSNGKQFISFASNNELSFWSFVQNRYSLPWADALY